MTTIDSSGLGILENVMCFKGSWSGKVDNIPLVNDGYNLHIMGAWAVAAMMSFESVALDSGWNLSSACSSVCKSWWHFMIPFFIQKIRVLLWVSWEVKKWGIKLTL